VKSVPGGRCQRFHDVLAAGDPEVGGHGRHAADGNVVADLVEGDLEGVAELSRDVLKTEVVVSIAVQNQNIGSDEIHFTQQTHKFFA
jgi:hypothetical protein